MILYRLADARLLLLSLLIAVMIVSVGDARLAAQSADPLAAARGLEENGEYEAAEAAYRVAMSTPGQEGLVARLALARLYERWERFDDALRLLESLTTADSQLPIPSRAWFQYGSVLQSLGRPDESSAAYGRAVQLESAASAYARIESAKMLLAKDEKALALATLAPLLDNQGPENARRIALRLAAPVAEGMGAERTRDALAYYRAHAALATTAAERVPSLYKTGVLERSLGNRAAAADAFSQIVTLYPAFGEAESSLEALTTLGRPATALEAALVHYRRRNNETARRLYNTVLANGTTAERAISLFYLGALAERREEPRIALENYSESLAVAPDGRLVDDALWARAGVAEDLGDLAAAQTDYARITARGGSFARAAEAAFRNGYISYEAGDLPDARRRWSTAAGADRDDVAATASFWAGRAAAELGDPAAARTAYAESARRDPAGFYGLRAGAMLAGQPTAPRNAFEPLRAAQSDWAGAEIWLAGWAGPEDADAWARLQSSEDWRATVELAEAGWSKVALDAFVMLLNRRADQPWLQYRAGRALLDAGFPRAAYAAGSLIAAQAPAGPIPAAIMRLRYPAPWPDLVGRYAERRGIDPLLFYAMMRQESAFNPFAGSSAGAFGLTQFIEGTARDVGRALGTNVPFAQLVRPALAIEFGAFYLAAQIRAREGNVYQGLAAYNGGGTNAERWQRNAGGAMDVDRFTEEIDFPETETYIRIVIENYAWYRYLYGAADRPSIVR